MISAWKNKQKNPAGQGEGLEVSACGVGWYFQSSGGILDLIEKMAFEQRLEGGKGVSPVKDSRQRQQLMQKPFGAGHTLHD